MTVTRFPLVKRCATLAVAASLPALICVSNPAAADVTDSGQLVLQLRFKPGEALRYQTNMKLGFTLPMPAAGAQPPPRAGSVGDSVGGTEFTVNAVQDIRVRRAGPSGGGDLEVTTTGQNSLPGQPPVLSNDTRPVVMTYDAQGKLTGIRRQAETASSNPMFGAMLGQGLLSMQGLMLPTKPVRIGETWTQQVSIPGITGGGSSTIKTTLTRLENLGKYRTAHLHVVITTPVSAYLDAALQPTTKPAGSASTMTGTAVVTDEINFSLTDGRVIRSVSKGVTSMTVAVGKPTVAPPPVRRRKGSPAQAPPAPQKGAQTLKMSVRTDIETNLADPPKKLPGVA